MADAHSTQKVWRPVEGWPGYEVSSEGELRRSDGSTVRQAEEHGYRMVYLQRRVYVHRIVAQAFHPNSENKPSVNHINNDGEDNRAVNLEWCTQAENMAHAREIGAFDPRTNLGKRGVRAKFSDEQIRDIRWRAARGGWTHPRLGKAFGVTKHAIRSIVTGKSYRYVK